jgi:hypothetical protein
LKSTFIALSKYVTHAIQFVPWFGFKALLEIKARGLQLCLAIGETYLVQSYIEMHPKFSTKWGI